MKNESRLPFFFPDFLIGAGSSTITIEGDEGGVHVEEEDAGGGLGDCSGGGGAPNGWKTGSAHTAFSGDVEGFWRGSFSVKLDESALSPPSIIFCFTIKAARSSTENFAMSMSALVGGNESL